MLLMMTGLRRSEVLGLALDCVDLEDGKVAVKRTLIEDEDRTPLLREKAKTASSLREVTIPSRLVERLRVHKAFILEQKLKWGRDYAPGPMLVFPEAGGGPPNPSTWTIRLPQIMRQHAFRVPSPYTATDTPPRPR